MQKLCRFEEYWHILFGQFRSFWSVSKKTPNAFPLALALWHLSFLVVLGIIEDSKDGLSKGGDVCGYLVNRLLDR